MIGSSGRTKNSSSFNFFIVRAEGASNSELIMSDGSASWGFSSGV